MIETLIEKGKADARVEERESPFPPQEKLGPPGDNPQKHTGIDGTYVQCYIDAKLPVHIPLYVHQQHRRPQGIPDVTKHHFMRLFKTMAPNEVHGILMTAIPYSPTASEHERDELFHDTYPHYADEPRNNICHIIAEVHRNFDKG